MYILNGMCAMPHEVRGRLGGDGSFLQLWILGLNSGCQVVGECLYLLSHHRHFVFNFLKKLSLSGISLTILHSFHFDHIT